jgi:hypothetical protein
VNSGVLVLGKSSGTSVHALGGVTETVNNGGTLRLGGSGGDQIQDGASVVVNSGGTFDVAGLSETINALTLNGTGVGGAALTNSSASAATLTLNNASPILSNFTIGLNGNLTLAGSGALSNSAAITATKTGAGTLTLTAGTADNVNLLLAVSNGTVVLNKASSSTVHAVGALSVYNGGTVQLSGSGGYQIYQGATPAINSGGVLDLNGQSQTFTGAGPTISGAGGGSGVLMNSSSGTPSTLTSAVVLGASSTVGGAGSLTISGAVSDGGNGYALTKAGSGTLTLQGVNTYTGNTVISAGALALGSGGAISNSANLVLSAGATLDVSAIATFNLSSSTTLKAAGTGAAPGSTAATLKGGTAVNLNSQPLLLTFTPGAFTGDTTHPALLVSNASLTLNNNAITVTNAGGSGLGAGVYRLVQVGNGTGGTISGAPNASVTVAGSGLLAGNTATLAVANGDINLNVATNTTTTLVESAGGNPSTYGSGVTLQATVSPAPANGETVTFKDGGTTLGTGTTTGGVATYTTSALAHGSHSLTAVYGGDTTDNGSTSGTLSLTVNPATVTVTSGLAANSIVYDGTNTATIVSNNVVLSGVLAGDAANVALSTNGYAAVFSSKNVANGVTVTVSGLSLTGTAAANYSLTQPALNANITAKPLTAAGTLAAQSRPYNGTTVATLTGSAALLTAEAAGSGTTSDNTPYTGDTVSVTGTPAGAFSGAGVGTGLTVSVTGLSLSGGQAGNYSLTAPSFTANITASNLTITANNDAKTYGGTKSYGSGSTAFSSSGLQNGETIGTVTVTASGGTTATAPIGAYSLTPSAATGGTFTAANYNITYANGTLTVNPLGVTVTADAQSKLYGTADPALTYSNSPALVGSDSFMGALTRAAGSNVGSYAITQGTLALSTNYSLSYVGANLTITASNLTITANSTSKAFGTTLSFAGTEFTTSALVSGDSVTSVTLQANGGTNATDAVGSYTIIPSAATGSGLGNYNLSYANGTLTVTPGSSGLSVSSSLNPAGYQASLTFGASVSTNATGSVTFSSAAGPFSTNTLSNGSATSLALSTLPRGTNVITVVYSGDSNFNPATNSLNQIVTNHPPVAATLFVTVTSSLPAEVSLSNLATNWSDVDGDTVELAAVNFTSTNGVTVTPINLTTNLDGSYAISGRSFLGYTSSAFGTDQISYTIQDGYGGITTGYINLTVQAYVAGTNSITSITGGSPTMVTAYGVPGFAYITQRSTNLSQSVWVNVTTNTAATNGVINASDTFGDLGGNPPAQAFYRLLWQP